MFTATYVVPMILMGITIAVSIASTFFPPLQSVLNKLPMIVIAAWFAGAAYYYAWTKTLEGVKIEILLTMMWVQMHTYCTGGSHTVTTNNNKQTNVTANTVNYFVVSGDVNVKAQSNDQGNLPPSTMANEQSLLTNGQVDSAKSGLVERRRNANKPPTQMPQITDADDKDRVDTLSTPVVISQSPPAAQSVSPPGIMSHLVSCARQTATDFVVKVKQEFTSKMESGQIEGEPANVKPKRKRESGETEDEPANVKRARKVSKLNYSKFTVPMLTSLLEQHDVKIPKGTKKFGLVELAEKHLQPQ